MFLSGEENSESRAPTRKMTLQQPEPDSDNTDGRSGFGYSQKYFHISDGNLYSVFSPLQGRCYGVRPAFLRQHSSRTHHQSHPQQPPQPQNQEANDLQVRGGRGRGNRRGSSATRGRRSRGLKFHNFVPAEKTGPTLAPPESSFSSSGYPWATPMVHSECRLREEHGTKQITVANYWASEVSPPKIPESPVTDRNKGDERTLRTVGGSPVRTQGVDRENVVYQNLPESNVQIVESSSKDEVVIEPSPEWKTEGKEARPCQKSRHRRKPLQTRQVIPYPTYLSMLHDDCPLDLSQGTTSQDGEITGLNQPPQGSTSTLEALLLLDNKGFPRDQSTQSRFELPTTTASGSGLQQTSTECVSRRPSHRTLIRQRLEDTFKQNGFLVKTKQVSDGDATFCKFKQLRKYTRYYLKSWHQHLPEEVHKLWKGFLPPNSSPSGAGGGATVPTTPGLPPELLGSPTKWTDPSS